MTVPPAPTRVESAPILPSEPAAFSLQVVLSDAATDGSGPFIVLSEDEDFARVYLAVFKGTADCVVDFAALKLPRNTHPIPVIPDASLNNESIEARWSLESDRLRELSLAGLPVPRWLRPGSEGTERLPPLLFCLPDRRFFSPPCPRCGAALTVCRDDAVLAAARLPLFRSSLERFLHCPRCAAENPPSAFYSFDAPAETPEGEFLTAVDLYRDLGEALAGAEESGAVAASFPCSGCREAAQKFQTAFASGTRAAPFWEGRWQPLNFYDSPFVLTGLGQLSLDEFGDWLGGRPRDSFAGEKPSPHALALGARLRYPVELASEGRLLFGGDGSGMDAVEIFFLKLTAFRQIVGGLLAYCRHTARPHLDLHPRHALFDLSAAGEGLPSAWTFRARIHGLSSAARSERLAGAADVVVPPRNALAPYAPPEALEFHLTASRPAQLVLSELEAVSPGRDAAGGWRLHGRLSDPYGMYPEPSNRDWILVTLDNEALGLSALTFVSRRDPRVQGDPREAQFISEPVALEELAAQRLRKSFGVRIPGARYKIYADFGAPSDLYSLGMILLRLLLGNDAQDARGIQAAVERVGKRLGAAGETTLSSVLAGPGAAALLERDPELAAAFRKANVFYQALDRESERPNAIPDVLWKRALLLGLRLATRLPGFSVCASPADYDDLHPTEKIERLGNEVELLAAEARGLLFGRQGANLEIQQVLAELLTEKVIEETPARREGASRVP
ncbi:MAG TPA: hypothetical protein VMR54_10985 [Thermoanaerobaculia bacterium]|nr:hypothetical protein [Thermoanaerobaculia bacterium]